MLIPFHTLTRNDATAKIAVDSTRDTAAKANRLFYDGDHWQDGAGWMGPIPKSTDPLNQDLKTEIARAFNSKNVIRKAVSRLLDATLGREPMFALTTTREVTEDAPLSEDEQKRLSELNDAYTAWWDKRNVKKKLREAFVGGKLGERVCLRLYVPKGLLVDGAVPTGTLEESLDKIFVQVTAHGQAGIFTDDDTQMECAVYVEKRDGKDVMELVYVDGDMTIIRTVSEQEKPGDASTQSASGGGADAQGVPPDAYPLLLGKRLTIREIETEELITQQVRENQMAINLAKTMQNRNVVTGGFLERIVLDAMPPGKWIDDPENSGKKIYEVGPFQVGAGTTNFYVAAQYEDEEGKPSFGKPSVYFRDPVSPDTFIASKRDCYQDILEEVGQQDELISGDATASGESRKQARAIFKAFADALKSDIDPVGRWLVETPLVMAGVFAGRPDILRDLRANFDCIVDTGPRTSDEMREDRDAVSAGLLSRQTAMGRNGIEDPSAELNQIQDEEGTSLERKLKQAQVLQTLEAGGAGFEAAAVEAGFNEEAAAAMARRDFPENNDDGDNNDQSGQVDTSWLVAGIQAETTLNGAQITAALEIINRLNGEGEGVKISKMVATELLTAVGIPRETAKTMVNNSQGA